MREGRNVHLVEEGQVDDRLKIAQPGHSSRDVFNRAAGWRCCGLRSLGCWGMNASDDVCFVDVRFVGEN